MIIKINLYFFIKDLLLAEWIKFSPIVFNYLEYLLTSSDSHPGTNIIYFTINRGHREPLNWFFIFEIKNLNSGTIEFFLSNGNHILAMPLIVLILNQQINFVIKNQIFIWRIYRFNTQPKKSLSVISLICFSIYKVSLFNFF